MACFAVVSRDRLTRDELSWLLTQEARGATRALREGVTQIVTERTDPSESDLELGSNLDTLEDAISWLDQLQPETQVARRRGAVDLAELLGELAPGAQMALRPGTGTEVHGDERELRRMITILLAHAPRDASRPQLELRREGEWVKLAVALGPEGATGQDLERRWLSRMAVRLGGRVEFGLGRQTLWLPAAHAAEQREMERLKEELEQAQQLGAVYAKELAAAFQAGKGSSPPPEVPHWDPLEQMQLVARCAAVVARPWRRWLEDMHRDLSEATLPDGSPALRRLAPALQLLSELELCATFDLEEAPVLFEVPRMLRELAEELEVRHPNRSQRLRLAVPESLSLTTRRKGLRSALEILLAQAFNASPADAAVSVSLTQTDQGVLLCVEDEGPPYHPEDAGRSTGRPSGIGMLALPPLVEHLPAKLDWLEVGGKTRAELYFRR